MEAKDYFDNYESFNVMVIFYILMDNLIYLFVFIILIKFKTKFILVFHFYIIIQKKFIYH
jgi:hypothetical protein